jgi:hypothetical protein
VATLFLSRAQIDAITKGDAQATRVIELLIAGANNPGTLPPDGVYGDVTVSGGGTIWTVTSSGIADGVYGDITVSGGGTVWTVTSTVTPTLVADPGTTEKVVGVTAGGDIFKFGNLTHNSTTKTTSTSTMVAAIEVHTPLIEVDESVLAPGAIANQMVIFADNTNKLKVVRETGTVVQLDAVEVAQAGGLISTRRRLNFVSGAVVADNAGTDSADVTINVGGNSVTATVNFGASFTDKASVVVVGQAWVAATSEIVAQPMVPVSVDPDEMRLLGFEWYISSLVAGVGFTLTVYSQSEARGTYDFSCIGV